MDAVRMIEGSNRLIQYFGAWPSFHDAEIIDMHLWRGHVLPGDWDDRDIFPVITIKLRVLGAVQPTICGVRDDVFVTLRFHDVSNLQLMNFNHVNQIANFSVSVVPRGKRPTGEDLPPHLSINFEKGFGLAATFLCFRIEVLDATRALEEQ
jgi:hypothetical protein